MCLTPFIDFEVVDLIYRKLSVLNDLADVVGWLVTRMYCGEMAGCIEMPLGTSVGLMQCHILLDPVQNLM